MSRLGFIRLKCFSIVRTVRFYTTVLQFDLKRKAEVQNGTFTFAFLTPKAVGVDGHGVDLRFECERFKQLKFSKMSKVPICMNAKVRLVFYVRNMRDVILAVERSQTGAWVFTLPQRHSGVLISVVVDPNGILIELVELTEVMMKLPSQPNPALGASALMVPTPEKSGFQSAQVRFGHVVLKSSHALQHARYYEALFHPIIMTPGIDDEAEKKKRTRKNKQKIEVIEPGLSIVDKEDFPELLSTYVWVGAAPRSHCTTLCFMHKIERKSVDVGRKFCAKQTSQQRAERATMIESNKADTNEVSTAQNAFQYLLEKTNTNHDIDPFLGLGIYVKDLRTTVHRLERHIRFPVSFINEPEHQEAIGEVCGFVDSEEILVHLVDEHSARSIDEPIAAGRVASDNKAQSARERVDRMVLTMEEQKANLARFKAMENRRKKQDNNNSSTNANNNSNNNGVFPGRIERIKETNTSEH